MLLESLFQSIKNGPETFYKEVIDMSKTIQLKMRQYTDSINGRNNKDLSLAKVHMEFLNKLRLNNPNSYRNLVYFAYIYKTLDIDEQPIATKSFLPSIGL